MRIKAYGSKNSKQAKCKHCHSFIEYWDNEVEQEYISYPKIDKNFYVNYITCPVCKNKIKLD